MLVPFGIKKEHVRSYVVYGAHKAINKLIAYHLVLIYRIEHRILQILKHLGAHVGGPMFGILDVRPPQFPWFRPDPRSSNP